MHAYKLTVYATNPHYGSREDISDHYIATENLDDAIAHVRGYMEKAGWKIRQIRDNMICITILRNGIDVEEESDSVFTGIEEHR